MADVVPSATVSKIQRWVSLDNKIEVKKSRLKEYQDEKKELEESILDYISRNNKHNLQINTSDGYIDFHEMKSSQLMTLKYIKDTLEEFFSRGPSEVNGAAIMRFLLDNRETKTKVTMRRHITA